MPIGPDATGNESQAKELAGLGPRVSTGSSPRAMRKARGVVCRPDTDKELEINHGVLLAPSISSMLKNCDARSLYTQPQLDRRTGPNQPTY